MKFGPVPLFIEGVFRAGVEMELQELEGALDSRNDHCGWCTGASIGGSVSLLDVVVDHK
jgi:hypothetical protein